MKLQLFLTAFRTKSRLLCMSHEPLQDLALPEVPRQACEQAGTVSGSWSGLVCHADFLGEPKATWQSHSAPGPGFSKRCQRAAQAGTEELISRAVHRSCQRWLFFVFFFKQILNPLVKTISSQGADTLVRPSPSPSFVLLFELGPLEEHCKVPLLGLQGPFLVQLMSHK